MDKVKQISKNTLIEKLDNMSDTENVQNCKFSNITTVDDGLRSVDLDTATPYIYPNDVTNNCVCKTTYENIGEYWYCRSN
jgi:hypothetical protein